MSPEERDVIVTYAWRCAMAGDWHRFESAATRLEPADRSQFRDQLAVAGTIVASLL